MADIVQGVLEDMVPDLMNFIEREIFTEEQVKEIIEKRRALEYKLVRRVPLKHHFLAAIQYELTLEDKRVERKRELSLKPASSDRAIIRRIINLFQRFTTQFKSDFGVWKEFINFCIRSKSDRQLSKATTKALQFHSNNVEIWLIARYIEEKLKSDIDSARGIMQRAVTLNNKNERLWEEYLKFELQHAKDTSVPKIVYKHACQALPLSKAHFKALLHISN